MTAGRWWVAAAAAWWICAQAGAARAESVEERFEAARLEFEYKNFDRAAEVLRGLLYPSVQLSREEDIVAAREMLGLCSFYLGDEARAQEEFRALLYLRPDHELDSFLVPPPAVQFFDAIRNEPQMKERLEQLERERRERLEAERLRAQAAGERRLYLERDVVRRERWMAFLPFGLGQFSNGDDALGIGLAVGQGVALATNIVCFSLVYALADGNGRYARDEIDLARGLQITQYSAAALFAALWVWGAVDANIKFRPVDLEPFRTVREEVSPPPEPPALAPTALPGGAGLMFQTRF